jgi:hypothetical protein
MFMTRCRHLENSSIYRRIPLAEVLCDPSNPVHKYDLLGPQLIVSEFMTMMTVLIQAPQPSIKNVVEAQYSAII